MSKLVAIFFLFVLSFQVSGQNYAEPHEVSTSAPVIPAAQARSIDGIARFINTHYKSPQDKVKAIYQWLTSNIAYDVQALSRMPLYYEKQSLIAQTLITRKAVCQGYAEVFHELCAKTGIPSYLITGFVVPRGTSAPMSHAWCAANLGGQWYLFDPTWGAGMVERGKFVPRINPKYYMVSPAKMVQTHLPFDPLWQFLAQPLTYQEFLTSRGAAPQPRPVFHFKDSLATYEASSEKAQLTGAIRRIEIQPTIPAVALDQLNHLKKNLSVVRENETIDLYNEAVVSFNTGIEQLNQFIQYRNNRFQPIKPDQELRQMTNDLNSQFSQTKRLLQKIKPADNTNLFLSLQNMKAMVEKAFVQVAKQEIFLKRYLKTPASQRHTLFYRQALADKN
ncbi:transglutaminase domain-containing protein [Rufibacter latericius]|nr:transglutaminase domain-containing protein [Rufibacter latericius]